MTATMGNRGFWLPSEFLTGDDILLGKENLNKNAINTAFTTNFGFHTEFPYDSSSHGSSVLSSPVQSVVGSTETDSDEDDSLAGLNRQLARSSLKEKAQQNPEKSWVMSGSPQSTLSAVGSWSGHVLSTPSPPETPLGIDIDGWDLISVAAGHVARRKMNGENHPQGRGFVSPPQILTPIQHPSRPEKPHDPNTGFYVNQSLSPDLSQTNHFGNARQDQMLKQQCSSIWGRQIQLKSQGFESNGRYERQLGFAESGWRPVQVQRQNHQNHPPQRGVPGMRAVFHGGSGVKRECAGTGVFLPRRYGSNNPSTEYRKKPGCSTALLPAGVVQALNNNFCNMASQTQPQSSFNNAFSPEYDNLMGRRNVTLNQQRWSRWPEGRMSYELCLPQEWTY